MRDIIEHIAENPVSLLWIWLVLINIVSYVLMGLDKQFAKRGSRRIRERTLFISAIIGGSIGSILGMQSFRHKTKHKSFYIGMPAILIIQLIAACIIIYYN